MALHADVPPPTVIVNTTGTGLQPGILDIAPFMVPGYPPVIQIAMSAAATVVVYGAMEVDTSAAPALVNPTDVSGGGFAASEFYDLVPGIRFYQFDVTVNAGTVIIKAGVSPMKDGTLGTPSLVRMTTNATQGM